MVKVIDANTGEFCDLEDTTFAAISFEHAQIHSGKVYTYSMYIPTLSGSGTYYAALETGDNLVHLSACYRSNQDIRWESRTEFAYNDDGTLITPRNLRADTWGNSAYDTAVRCRHGMTVTDPGTVTMQRYIPSAGKHAGLTTSELGIEFIFNKNTNYLFSYTNLASQSAIFNLIVDFYEMNL